ncbi:HupE/UreJ family protein [Ensifer aridi]|uniref:HupE/UreJ family protein n=1 Tax=Ensifer aridi TaxID=1708715 RepID=UPI000A11844F|nr:HupE/UreJ family protein [Ensifer aridi]
MRWTSDALCLLLALALAGPALAHTETGDSSGFLSGFLHPIVGPDHVIAMVAVGLWGAFLRTPAIWGLPIVFPLVMAFGGALGIAQVDFPAVETGIALSAVILGLCVAFAFKPPLWVAASIVGAFAVFHGYAHGTEMPEAADAMSFALGFVIATGLLHLCGIALGALARWPSGAILVRGAGGLIAAAGGAYLSGVM